MKKKGICQQMSDLLNQETPIKRLIVQINSDFQISGNFQNLDFFASPTYTGFHKIYCITVYELFRPSYIGVVYEFTGTN